MGKIRNSLANTLSVAIAAILFLVFLVIGGISFRYIEKKAEANILEVTYAKSEAISKDVINIFENAQLNTSQMALNRDVVNYLKEVKTRNDIWDNHYYRYVLDYIVKVKDSNDLHFLAWVANENANFYLDSSNTVPGEDYDVKKRPWYDVAIKNESVAFTPPYVEWDTQKTVILSILALREADRIYGFVVVDIMLDSLPDIFEKAEMSALDMSFLITEDGFYVYHPDERFIMKSSIYDEKDELNPYISEILSKEKKLSTISYRGKNYYLTSYPLEINEWRVVTLIDQESSSRELMTLFYQSLAIMLSAFFVAVLLIHFIVRNRTSPYKMLVSFADAIALGNYENNIPSIYRNRSDEMGHICEAFQRVLDTLRNENLILEDKINKKNIELEQQYSYILETEKAASLGNLVAGVAHEINTPLGVGISTTSHIEQLTADNLELIASGQMTKEDLVIYFENISESTRLLGGNLSRAAELVKSFKKIAVEQGSEIKEKFILREVFEDVILSMKGEYKRQNHEIRLNCDENIEIDSYPGAYTQILTNLIMNSIQHGFKDKTNGEIDISCKMDGPILTIIYYDDGSGISEENIGHVFEPFFTTNRINGNSGLGMNVIYNLVCQKLDGKIKLESEYGKYTRITIELPNLA